MYKLFVSGFPLEITEMELAKLIGPHGTIATMKIVRDKKTRICKGYAFVEMDGVMIGERALTVKISEEKPADVKPRFNRPVTNISRGYGYGRPEGQPSPERDKRPRV
jgi:hypothetical protein